MKARRLRAQRKPDICTAFGSAIRRRRLEVGLTQEELADRARVHRTYIGDIERGARNVALRNVEKLASALGLTVAELFSEFGIGGQRRASDER